MGKTPMNYYSSDWHFSHRNILNYERGQKFSTIEEHDNYLFSLLTSWAQKWVAGSTLWFLGDFGNPDYMWVFNLFRAQGITVNFIRGNHDTDRHRTYMDEYVDNFYEYPQYLSQRLILGHYPQNVWSDQLCIHGHLHSAILDGPNFINANIHIHSYTPVSDKEINNIFTKIDKYSRKFLEEPYTSMYRLTQKKEDIICDKDGRIDLSATRLYNKLVSKNLLSTEK